mmetsp:Transcript_3360/g.5125  ORF Transcript_3360/g.5125 Transcript_3360/m.5125 type:complete len:382 (-) Transcript_3360:863-2008(-)
MTSAAKPTVLFTLTVMMMAAVMVDSFVTFPSSTSKTSPAQTALFGRSIKRGNLAKNVSPGGISKTKSKGNKKKGSGGSKASAASSSSSSGKAAISSSLAEWAAQGGGGASSTSSSTPSSTASATEFASFEEDYDTDSFSTTKSKKGGKRKNVERRERQSSRRAEDEARERVVTSTVDDIESLLETPNTDLSELIKSIRTLVDKTPSQTGSVAGAMRNLSISPQSKNYRMAWVGSDDALCHIGTGLHKVPLARLEEVFLCMESKTVRVLEVIRILGPFPNVRNTLMGNTSILKPPSGRDDGKSKFRIEYNSMIDGTGKEILAGKEDNVKLVDLDVLFADEKVIVCAVPTEGDEDPFVSNGSKVLLFVQEDSMDEKLESLRAA